MAFAARAAVLYAALSLGCSSSDNDELPLVGQASRLFGMPVSEVQGAGLEPWVGACQGRDALVVPPRGRVEIPLRRGFHTLTGNFGICEWVGAEPVEFRAELKTKPVRALFAQRVAVENAPMRRAFPFMVTFWAEEDLHVVLRTVGQFPTVQSAWSDVSVYSELRPPTGVGKQRTPLDSPKISAVPPDHIREPGKRLRRDPMQRQEGGYFWLPDWGWAASGTSWGPIEIGRANGSEGLGDGPPMKINDRTYTTGVGMHAPGRIVVDLERRCHRFVADVGIDDEVGSAGSAVFWVWGDGKLLFKSEVLTGKSEPARVDVSLEKLVQMVLQVTDAGDANEQDWTDWGDPRLYCD